MFLPCGRDLVADFNRVNTDIIIGQCPFQHPDRWKEILFPDPEVQDPDTPFSTEHEKKLFMHQKYINAGIIMGRVSALEHYISGVFVSAGYIDKKDLDDQS